jgi:hypothetical protein
VANAVDDFVRTQTEVDTDYLLPLRVDFGVSGSWRAAMLSGEVGYSDWTSAAIERTRLRTRELQTVFREVLEIKVGTEVTVPRVPVRLRAGYARLPYPLRYLPSDRIELQELERVRVDREREMWAMGAGVLIGRWLTVDAAYTHTSGERSVENYSQSNTTHRVVLTAACRF